MKKHCPLMIFHLVMMLAMLLGSTFAAIKFSVDFNHTAGMARLENLTNVFLMLLVMGMLVMGSMHLFMDYNKRAAKYYKAFLVLLAAIPVLTIFINLCFSPSNVLLTLVCVLYAVKAVLFLVLAFGKDLGRRKTWTLFYVILALDIGALILGIIYMSSTAFDFSFTGYITALVADGTVGLSISGKYRDKSTRGSK